VGSVDDARIWNRVLSSSEVTTIFAGGDPSITGLLAYWRIEESSGSTLNDASGNGNTITFNNPPTWTSDVSIPPFGGNVFTVPVSETQAKANSS